MENGKYKDQLDRIEENVSVLNSELTDVIRDLTFACKDMSYAIVANTKTQEFYNLALKEMAKEIAQAFKKSERSVPAWMVVLNFVMLFALIFGVVMVDRYIAPFIYRALP